MTIAVNYLVKNVFFNITMFSVLLKWFLACFFFGEAQAELRTITKLERDMFIVRNFNQCDNLLKILAYSQLFNAEVLLGDYVVKEYTDLVDALSSRVALQRVVARYLQPFKANLKDKLLVETGNSDLYQNRLRFDVCNQLSNGVIDLEKMYQLVISFDPIVYSNADLECTEWKKCVAWQKENAKIYLSFFINLAMFSKKLGVAVVKSFNETPKDARLIDRQNLIEKHIKQIYV
jgi:hypothetical protein